jgi:hypothetical protein
VAVSKITLESTNGDSLVVSSADDEYLEGDIILDTDPEGMYDVGFTVRTQSGAFETGGRVVGIDVPIREPMLPFHITPASRPRLQSLWGTPGNLQKVKATWDGPSGPRWLMLRLASEIRYTTEDGLDADVDDSYHAVVSTLAPNPMYESAEDGAQWTNPDDRFTLAVVGSGGTFPLTFGGQTTNVYSVGIVGSGGTFALTVGGQTANPGYGASVAAVQAALEALSSVGAGNAIVTGSPGAYFVALRVAWALTGSATNLTGTGKAVNITAGVPWNATPAMLKTALESLTSVGAGKVGVAGTPATSSTTGTYSIVFAVGTNGVLTGTTTGLIGTGLGLLTKSITVDYAPNTGWFEVWNPTDQPDWLEWEFDPAKEWQFPDHSFGQERKWNRPAGADANRMIITVPVVSLLSVMSDPFMDTWLSADLSNFAGLMNGVEPMYMVPPYTDPVMVPVVCRGPAGAKATLRQRRFWSAESGLEA